MHGHLKVDLALPVVRRACGRASAMLVAPPSIFTVEIKKPDARIGLGLSPVSVRAERAPSKSLGEGRFKLVGEHVVKFVQPQH